MTRIVEDDEVVFLDADKPALIERGRLKTGSPLDKLADLIPREARMSRPGLMHRFPVQCCATCQSCKKDAGKWVCHPKGSWFIKEIKGGELSVQMPHSRTCWKPSEESYIESFNDPMNVMAERINDYVRGLEAYLRRIKEEGPYSDKRASRLLT